MPRKQKMNLTKWKKVPVKVLQKNFENPKTTLDGYLTKAMTYTTETISQSLCLRHQSYF